MGYRHKFMELHIRSLDIDYLVKFNDVLVYSEINSYPVNLTIPLNHWVSSGNNVLLVSIDTEGRDPINEVVRNSMLDVSLVIREKSKSETERYTITNFNINPSQNDPELIASSSTEKCYIDSRNFYRKETSGDIKIGAWSRIPYQTWIRFEQQINVDIGLPRWTYLDADYIGSERELSDHEYFALTDELYDEYVRVWRFMKDKNIDELLPLLSLRSHEYEAAYYLDLGEKLNDMRQSLRNVFEHDELYLSDLVSNKLATLSISAFGQIANLKISRISKPLIFYSHRRDSFTKYYDFYFMRRNGRWTIIR